VCLVVVACCVPSSSSSSFFLFYLAAPARATCALAGVEEGATMAVITNPDTPAVKRRTAKQNWRLLKTVWHAMRAFIGDPSPATLIKRAHKNWHINEHTTTLTKTLSIGGKQI
jgi:hypothetical protein